MSISAAEIKTALLQKLPEVCAFLLPNGHPDGPNWRVGSVAGEEGSSLSVSLQGPHKGQWKDFADDDSGGDVLALWMAVHRVAFRHALSQAHCWLLHQPSPRSRSAKAPASDPAPSARAIAMPPDVAAIWKEGVRELAANCDRQAQLDLWRRWPAGSAEALNTLGLIGCPEIGGKPYWAFPVQYPGHDGIVQLGYHARPLASTSPRARWIYRPNNGQDGFTMPVPPFMLGAEEFSSARLVVITEGQWDAVAWAAAAGWLHPSREWPRGVAVVGIRGASAWRSLRQFWKPRWPKAAEFLVIPDADKAGKPWFAGFADQLRPDTLKLTVWALPAGIDFSDYNHAAPPSPAFIADLLEALGFSPVL